ncbi:hypothetical protein MPTK2_4g01270 [Marchantia polymorpha subsp. ruderalis]
MGELLHCREALPSSSHVPFGSSASLSRAAFSRSYDVKFRRLSAFNALGTASSGQRLRRSFAGEENCQSSCDGCTFHRFSVRSSTWTAGLRGHFSRTGDDRAAKTYGGFCTDHLAKRNEFDHGKLNGTDGITESKALFRAGPSTLCCTGREGICSQFSKFDIHCCGRRVHSHSSYFLNTLTPLQSSLVRSRNVYYRDPTIFYRKRSSHIVNAKSNSWWKDFLFKQLNDDDIVYGEDEEDDGPDGPEDFEDEADFISNINGDNGEIDPDPDEVDRLLSDDRKFFSWQQKREAIDELREYQETERDPDSRDWEDWLDESWSDPITAGRGKDGGWYTPQSEWEKEGVPRDAPKKPERGMNRTIKELLLRIFENQEEVEDDLNFEERVFRFTSQSTAKFVTILILVPWAVDFFVHDFVMVPFLRRWVEEVPLAAKVLDLKESQKLHLIEELKLERQRVRFEAEIGKAPPLTDEELNEHIREEALELREELREENRQAFGNLWSDALAGFTVFLLLVLNPSQVAIMRTTGDRLFTNISDTGKAFIIILGTDIFLGYHSESGWETVIEMLLDHYGLEASQASIYIFVAIVPVTIDACFKLWVFRYLTRLSPSAAATFREMKRH